MTCTAFRLDANLLMDKMQKQVRGQAQDLEQPKANGKVG